MSDTLESITSAVNQCKSCRNKKILIWFLLIVLFGLGIYSLIVSILFFGGYQKKEKFTDDIDDDGDLMDDVDDKIDDDYNDYINKNKNMSKRCSCIH